MLETCSGVYFSKMYIYQHFFYRYEVREAIHVALVLLSRELAASQTDLNTGGVVPTQPLSTVAIVICKFEGKKRVFSLVGEWAAPGPSGGAYDVPHDPYGW